jgi:hypothetical protein
MTTNASQSDHSPTPTTDEGPCAFCHHPQAIHTDGSLEGCAAPLCPDPEIAGQGRCAVYTSQAHADAVKAWFADSERPVTITAVELAKTVHFGRFGDHDHSRYSSCSCLHEAMFLLGFPASSALSNA